MTHGIRAAVLFRPRIQSYDWDWLDSIEKAFDARTYDVRRCPPSRYISEADVVLIMHSVFDRELRSLEPWVLPHLQKRRGKLVIFYTNEFREFERRSKIARDFGASFVVSALPQETAKKLYTVPVISLPAALNPNAFDVFVPWRGRAFDIGYRGVPYAGKLSGNISNNRAKLIEMAADRDSSDVITSSVFAGAFGFHERPRWAAALNDWRVTVATEAGLPGAKCISSRVFDAIGTGTCQILERGEYNGILKENEHFVPFDFGDPRGTAEAFDLAFEFAKSDSGEEITRKARTYIMDTNTYKHRMAQLISAIEVIP